VLFRSTNSKDYHVAGPIIAEWAKVAPVKRADDFKTLMIYQKTR
jgi:hypothetical protein